MPIEMMMKWIIAAVVCYGGTVALLYVAQRSLQYFPERRRTAPQAVGLPEAEEVVLDTADGERVIVWHVPPREKQPIFLYFHGNGGSLHWRDERFRALISDGSGLIALTTAVTAGRPDGRPKRAFSRTLLRRTRSPSPAILPNESSYGANRLARQSQSHWQQTTRSVGWCLRRRSPQRSMLVRSIIGSCRCGFS